MMGSWSAYQKYDDPPGNRLIKWHLAGVAGIDQRGSLETIVDRYRNAGFGRIVDNKWNNVEHITGIALDSEVNQIVDSIGEGDAEEAIAWIREYRFFELLPMLGLLLIGPIAMAIRRRRRESDVDWRFALMSFAYVGIGCFFWALMQWGPTVASTVIHAGTIAIPLIAIAGCVAAMASVSTRLAIALVAINALFVLVLYAPAFEPPSGTEYSLLSALLAAGGLAGYCLVALRPAPLLASAEAGDPPARADPAPSSK